VVRAGDRPDRAVDVPAAGLFAGVAIEERRQDLQRQSRGEETAVLLERAHDRVAELARERVVVGGCELLLTGCDR
jgi:hypothetical protein